MALSGFLLLFSAYVVWAISALFFKKAVSQHSPLLVTAVAASIGALVLLPVIILHRQEVITLPKGSWLWLIVGGVLWIALGQVLYSHGLKRVDLSRAGLLGLVFPVVATVLGVMFLDERITWQFVVGSVTMGFGFLIIVL